MSKKDLEFSGFGMVMSLAYLLMSFVLIHEVLLGEPFKSFLSLIVTIYLLFCALTFPYLLKVLNTPIDSLYKNRVPLTFSITQALYVGLYFVAPIVYGYLRFFKKE